MKRIVLAVFLSLVVASGIGGCGNRDGNGEIEIGTTQHDNWVYLIPYNANFPIAFNLSGHSISSGQPWGGVQTSGNLSIDIKAGRHGSSGPADWFRSNASAAICTMDSMDAWPSDLNFAVTGTLTINGTSYNVTIGQGFTGGSNNWWIGGPGWTNHTGIPNVMTPDEAYIFVPVNTSSDQFWVCNSWDNCPP